MKKFINEFKEFAVKGNVLNLAIGVIIGGAFQKIVTSLINDLIMPLIGLITGNANFNDQFFTIGSATFNYGSFISAVIDFLIMAFVIFLMVKAINKVTSIAKDGLGKIESKVTGEVPVEETPIAPSIKICPYCLSEIPYAALKCSHCTSEIPNNTYEEIEEYLE